MSFLTGDGENMTALNEFYRAGFRKKLYTTLEQIQAGLDAWLEQYNCELTGRLSDQVLTSTDELTIRNK